MYHAKSRNWKKALTLLLTLALLLSTLGMAMPAEAGAAGQDSIAAFDTLNGGIKEQTVPAGTAQKDLKLPDALDATDGDGNPVTVKGVTWECKAPGPGYDADTPGEYPFAPKIPATYNVEGDAVLPEITVTVEIPTIMDETTSVPTRTESEPAPTDTAQPGSIGADSEIRDVDAGVHTPPDTQTLLLSSGQKGESAQNPAENQTEFEAAISAASAGDTIYIQSVTLSGVAVIDKDLTIIGVNNAELTLAAGATYRHITSSASSLTLSNLTLTGINNTTSGGGGVKMTDPDSALTMEHCTVQSCYTTSGGGGASVYKVNLTNCIFTDNTAGGFGGGMDASTATLINCTFDGNVASTDGGGLQTITAILTNCTFNSNTADRGGGLWTYGTANLTNCLFDDNTADRGGGVYAGTAELTNCTLSNNESSLGGGVYAATANLTVCTLTGNTASRGGGVYSNVPTIRGSIVAGNTGNGNVYEFNAPWPDDGLTGDGNYNIIGYSAVVAELAVFGQAGPTLADNGGPTKTIALAPVSPAIGVIPTTGLSWTLPQKDQRGYVRDPNGTGFACIGAYEAEGAELVVKNANNDGVNSLRWCIDNSEADDTITFAPMVFTGGQVITLTSALPAITHDLTIEGPSKSVVIKADGNYRHILSSASSLALSNLTLTGRKTSAADATPGGGVEMTDPDSALIMENCTVKNCYNSSDGGGVYAEGTAALTDCTLTGNTANHYGGGMYVLGTATLTDCMVSGNTAGDGGGIWTEGTVTLMNCTVSGNTADSSGGGLWTYETATLTNCTVSGNSAVYGDGGGVFVNDENPDSTATLLNCTVTGNSASGGDSSGGGVLSGSQATLTNCTITNNSAEWGGGVYADDTATLTNCTLTGNSAGDAGGGVLTRTANIRGSIVSGNTADGGKDVWEQEWPWDDEAPNAGNNFNIIGTPSGCSLAEIFGANTLADNGGDTETILIKPNGPAHNVISAVMLTEWGVATDQRGVTRPQGTNGDIGAVELGSYTLSIVADMGGSITKGTGGSYFESEVIDIEATANGGYTFSGWTSSDGGSFTNADSAAASFTMPRNNVTVTAGFAVVPPDPTLYTIAVSANPANGGTVTGGGNLAENTSHTVTAAANANYRFVNWTEGGAVVSTSASYGFTVTGNRTLIANFAYIGTETLYTITASAGAHGNISPSGDVKVSEGGSGTFTFTPGSRYTIDKVTVDGENATAKNDTYTFTNVQRDHTINVTFKEVTGPPQTGDDGSIWLWVVLGLSSILAGLCLLVWRKWQALKTL